MSKFRKAIAAFAAAAAGAVLTSVTTNGLPHDQTGWLELLGAAAGVGVLAALAVYGIRNAPAVTPPASSDEAAIRRSY